MFAKFDRSSGQGPAGGHLAAVERWVLWLSAALLLASILLGSPRSQLGALCGAGITLLNARLLILLSGWLSSGGAEVMRQRLSLLVGLFQLKLGLLGALIYLTLRFVPVAPLWLLLGLSLLPISIVIRAIEHRASARPSSDRENPIEGERAISHHG
jgi:hypothetical protein